MDDDDIKYAKPLELWSQGILQELNRQFLHPLGLAFAFGKCEHTGYKTFPEHEPEDCPYPHGWYVGIYDYTDDPEGMFFELKEEDREDFLNKKNSVLQLKANKLTARLKFAKEHDICVSDDGVQEFSLTS